MQQETQTYEAEKVVSSLKFADGLVWSRAGFLAVADVRQNQVLRFDASPAPKILRENSGGVSGLAYDLKGDLYMCESVARRVSRVDSKGKLTTLAEGFEAKKFNAPNDIVVRRDGHVYFTDPAFGSAADRRELDFYGIFHISPKGDIDAAARWQTRPNGIALSADGKTLYATDSDRHAVAALDLDRNGNASNQRDVVQNVPGVPGGLRLDTDGRIYVASQGINVYSPQGKRERTFLDDLRTTNCAFGEAEFKALFVSARATIYRIRLDVVGAVSY